MYEIRVTQYVYGIFDIRNDEVVKITTFREKYMDFEYLLQIHMMLCLTSLLDNTYNTTTSNIIFLNKNMMEIQNFT